MNPSIASPRASAVLACLVTFGIAVGLHTLSQRLFDINLMSITVMLVVPIAAIALFFLALSGFFLMAHRTGLQVGAVDLVFLMATALAVLLATYAVDYFLLANPRPMSFLSYIAADATQTKHVIYMKRLPTDAPPVAAGDAGYLLLLVKIAAALASAKIVHLSCPQRPGQRWQSSAM